MRQCQWCYTEAHWLIPHGDSDYPLCNRHYDEREHNQRLEVLRSLKGEALELARQFHNARGRV